MKKAIVRQKVYNCAYIIAGIDVEKMTNDTHIKYDLGMDSLDKIEFVMELECEFDLDISDEFMDDANKLSDFVDHIYGRVKNRKA